MKLQLVWWWRFPAFKFWAYPRSYKTTLNGTPIFYGLDLGIVEVRYFPKRNGIPVGQSK